MHGHRQSCDGAAVVCTNTYKSLRRAPYCLICMIYRKFACTSTINSAAADELD